VSFYVVSLGFWDLKKAFYGIEADGDKNSLKHKKKALPASQIGLNKSNHFYQFMAGGIAVGTTLRTGFVLFKYLKTASISSCFMAT
jgi:hypothetical protein